MKPISLITTIALCVATSTFAGLQFQTQTSDKSGVVATTRGVVDGTKAKIEFVSGRSGPGMQKGNYMLSQDGGKTIYLVNPQEKSYIKLNLDQIASQVGQFMDVAKGFVSMTVSDPKIQTLLDERGPSIHGYATQHIKKRTAYTVSTSVLGNKNSTAMSREDEMWITKAIKDPGMKLWTMQRSIRTGHAEIDKIIEAEAQKLQGVPLKMISVTTTTKANGRKQVVTAINELTDIKRVKVPANHFALPKGYRDTTADAMGAVIKAGQEMGTSQGSKPGSPQDSVNNLLKGIFGGRK